MVEPTSAIATGRISANFSVRFAYSVYFTRRAFATGNPLLAQLLKPSRPNARARVFAAVESAVSAAHPHLSAAIADYCRHYGLDLAGEIFPLPAGEAAKTGGLGIALGLVEAMIKANLDRQSYLLAIGLMIDSFYAQLQGWISREATVKAREMIQNVKLDLIAAEFTHLLAERESLFQGLDDFRTHLGGELTLTFPCSIGRHREVHEIDFAVMNHAIDLAHAALNRPAYR